MKFVNTSFFIKLLSIKTSIYKTLNLVKAEVYDKISLKLADYQPEKESKEYEACRFSLNGKLIICRTTKITSKKAGLFVTFWKRNASDPIEPFQEEDKVDFYVVNVKSDDKLGQFVFPKAVLLQKGILSTPRKEGKRAIRVYPDWDVPTSKQALSTQKWQLKYFVEILPRMDLQKVIALYR